MDKNSINVKQINIFKFLTMIRHHNTHYHFWLTLYYKNKGLYPESVRYGCIIYSKRNIQDLKGSQGKPFCSGNPTQQKKTHGNR